MKRLSFFAAMLALILVATSSFKPAKTGGTVYGFMGPDGADIRLYDVTGLTIGDDYNCILEGDCLVAVTSGTVVDDPTEEDPRFVIVEDGTYEVIREGVFVRL